MLQYHSKNIKGRAYFLYYSLTAEYKKARKGATASPLTPSQQKSLGHMPKKISIFFGRDPAIFEKHQ